MNDIEKDIHVILPPIKTERLRCVPVGDYERLQEENKRMRCTLEKIYKLLHTGGMGGAGVLLNLVDSLARAGLEKEAKDE